MRRTPLLLKLTALLMVAGLVVSACGDDSNDSSNNGTSGGSEKSGPTIRIRGQEFSESITLAEVYGQYLKAKGYKVDILTAAGFRTEAIDALKSDKVDLIVDYIGGDQTALAPDNPPSQDAAQVVSVITPKFKEIGATVLPYSPAIDGDALVVRGDSTATKISDLKGMDLKFGAASECFERPQCYIGLTDPAKYGIKFAGTKTLEFGPLLGEALKAKEVDAVIWGTTAPEIKKNGFKILEDDKGLFPAQNIAPIISTKVLDGYGNDLRKDLDALSQKITTDDLVDWNTSTDIDKKESDSVAEDWLKAKGLL
jgi:osmoprotectant transport system substrate-binding protein